MATAYEYKVVDNRRGWESDRHFECKLNELGAEGWLLVTDSGHELVFVRTKEVAPTNPATSVTLTWGAPQPKPEE